MSRAAALVRQHIDGVARASSAGTKSGLSARSLVLLTILAPVLRTARLGDQLQLNDEANSEIADGSTVVSCRRHRTLYFRRRFANFQPQRATADPRVSVFRADTPRIYLSAVSQRDAAVGPMRWPCVRPSMLTTPLLACLCYPQPRRVSPIARESVYPGSPSGPALGILNFLG